MKILRQIPNCLTITRILSAFAMIFCEVFSLPFFIFYLLCGITDILDGFLARKLNAATQLGSILDSIADACFLFLAFYCILPYINIPVSLWVVIALVLLQKILNICYGYIFHSAFIMLHTLANKILGGVLFLLPFAISLFVGDITIFILSLFAFLTAAEECYIIILKRILQY